MYPTTFGAEGKNRWKLDDDDAMIYSSKKVLTLLTLAGPNY